MKLTRHPVMDNRHSNSSKWFLDEVLPHESDLRGWLCSRFSSVRDVDDIIQDAYSRMLKAHESGPIVNPRAFLFVTARNLSLNRIRHYRYEEQPGAKAVDPLSVVDEAVSPSECAANSEEVRILIQAIQTLPKRCRQVLTLRKIYGYSQAEVARKLGVSVHTVESQASIGLRKCMRYFQNLGYQTRKRK